MKNILVIDNNQMFLEYMNTILSAEGYSVVTAEGGLDALDYLEKNVPDVIFVDLIMPQIEGDRLCKIFKARPELKGTRVVIVSATAAEEGEVVFSQFADAYLAKMPFKKMRKPLLELLVDFDAGNTERYKDRVIGIDQIYRRNITEELLYAKEHLDVLLAGMSDGIIEMTTDFRILYVNPSAEAIIGKSEDNLLFSFLPDLFPAEVRPDIEAASREAESGRQEVGEEAPIILNDRQLFLRFLPVEFRDYRAITVVLQDITERKRAERLMKESLHQKETMLKEIHHRVKNNLQVVASLLSLQASCVHDEKISHYFRDSENRVNVMALIHEQLYEQEDISELNLKRYFEELVGQLVKTYSTGENVVRTSIDVPSVHLPIQTAIPLGLIVNETVTNSLVHGLRGVNEGRLAVTVEDTIDSLYRLSIIDNGTGIPEDFDRAASDSLGLSLVSSLTEQIGGNLELRDSGDGKTGTTVSISFPKPKP